MADGFKFHPHSFLPAGLNISLSQSEYCLNINKIPLLEIPTNSNILELCDRTTTITHHVYNQDILLVILQLWKCSLISS